jgi:iron complex transport system permease protein
LQSLLKNALAEPYVLGVSRAHRPGRFLSSYWGSAPVRCRSLRAFAGAFAAFAFVAFLTNGRAAGMNVRFWQASPPQLFNAITAYTIAPPPVPSRRAT